MVTQVNVTVGTGTEEVLTVEKIRTYICVFGRGIISLKRVRVFHGRENFLKGEADESVVKRLF